MTVLLLLTAPIIAVAFWCGYINGVNKALDAFERQGRIDVGGKRL